MPSELDRTPSKETEPFLRWLFAQGGLRAEHYRPETLNRRLLACLRFLRVDTTAEARAILSRNPSLVRPAIGTLVIGVTGFFRDELVFNHLRQQVLPDLLRGRSQVRIWSAACSDGPELYSVGMLVAEMGMLDRCQFLGTDCRNEAIARARDGIYDAQVVASIPEDLKRRYLEGEDGQWRMAPELRAAVQWRTADVLKVIEPGAWDLILCRNMVMYLRPEASAGLWAQLERALRPGGVLVVGKAERPHGTQRLSLVGPRIYRRDR